MEKVQKTLAIALKKQEWKEADLLFSFYTKEFGKIRAVAIGTRKLKSKLAGHLAQLGVLELLFVRGRAFNKVTQAHLKTLWPLKSAGAFDYVNCILEIVDKAMHDELKNERVWKLLVWALGKIVDAEGSGNDAEARGREAEERRLILNVFMSRLLEVLGYGFSMKNRKLEETLVEKLQAGRLTKAENKKAWEFLKECVEYHVEREISGLKMVS